MSAISIRKAREADIAAIVAMLADDALGRPAKTPACRCRGPIWTPSRR